jgi:hypothetical protein
MGWQYFASRLHHTYTFPLQEAGLQLGNFESHARAGAGTPHHRAHWHRPAAAQRGMASITPGTTRVRGKCVPRAPTGLVTNRTQQTRVGRERHRCGLTRFRMPAAYPPPAENRCTNSASP